jgi:hypothetical protein
MTKYLQEEISSDRNRLRKMFVCVVHKDFKQLKTYA